MLDADGSTDPAEIPRFVDALRQGADFAKGSRFMPGAGSSDISRLRQAGNFWLNRIVNVLYGTRYTDLCYGYNAFRRDCLDVIDLDPESPDDVDSQEMLWGDGFEVETLINVRIAKAGPAGLRGPELRAQPAPRHQQPERLLRRAAGAADDPHRAQTRDPTGRHAERHDAPRLRGVVGGAVDLRRGVRLSDTAG